MFDDAISQLKQILLTAGKNPQFKDMIAHKDDVLSHYGKIFSMESLPSLTVADFLSFLEFDNNHHWTGLEHHRAKIIKDMDVLRKTLLALHNTSHSIENRFDIAIRGVKGLGRGILTAVMLVIYPDNYGVWNGTSDDALKVLKVHPDPNGTITDGKRYVELNIVLCQLRDNLGIDLWTLDALFWKKFWPASLIDLDTSSDGTVETDIPIAEPSEYSDLELQ
jgi:hypothetical protein